MERATVDLLPRKAFEITRVDGTKIKGQFTLWSVKRYCDKKKLSLAQLSEQMTEENISMEDICLLILCAVEDTFRREKKGFAYTDQDACDWIEEMGGILSGEYISLMNHARSELPAEEEKKTEAGALTS